MAEEVDRLAVAANNVLVAWDSNQLDEAVRELGAALSDWLEANDLRQCDNCSRINGAGDGPDWPNGLCEDCDPSLEPPEAFAAWCAS